MQTVARLEAQVAAKASNVAQAQESIAALQAQAAQVPAATAAAVAAAGAVLPAFRTRPAFWEKANATPVVREPEPRLHTTPALAPAHAPCNVQSRT